MQHPWSGHDSQCWTVRTVRRPRFSDEGARRRLVPGGRLSDRRQLGTVQRRPQGKLRRRRRRQRLSPVDDQRPARRPAGDVVGRRLRTRPKTSSHQDRVGSLRVSGRLGGRQTGRLPSPFVWGPDGRSGLKLSSIASFVWTCLFAGVISVGLSKLFGVYGSVTRVLEVGGNPSYQISKTVQLLGVSTPKPHFQDAFAFSNPTRRSGPRPR